MTTTRDEHAQQTADKIVQRFVEHMEFMGSSLTEWQVSIFKNSCIEAYYAGLAEHIKRENQ